MTTRFQHLAVLAAALVALCVSVPFAGAADAPMSRDEAHRQIKVAERAVPIPTTVETTTIGTFDPATGEFDGLVTEIEIINGKPVRLVPSIVINAVNARLTFQIRNATKPVRVSLREGGFAFAPAGATSVTINAGRLSTVHWTITSGTKTHRDELIIKRRGIIGPTT